LTSAVLEVKGLTSGYGKLAIVQNVDLEVTKGNILALIGPNGSGKSTLIKSIVGAANVLEGKVYFERKDVTFLRSHEIIRLGISYVPQTQNVFESLSVHDNLELGAYTVEEKQILEERFEEVYQLFPALREKRKDKARTLSGGQRQVLAIGKSLMTRPSLLLLDEPTASVAPVMITQIMDKICEIQETGVTMILVEQNVKKALELADFTAVMVAGRIVFSGESEKIGDQKELGELFLGKKAY
jgi:branched-chain amino acid transport system ATP-binding protein